MNHNLYFNNSNSTNYWQRNCFLDDSLIDQAKQSAKPNPNYRIILFKAKRIITIEALKTGVTIAMNSLKQASSKHNQSCYTKLKQLTSLIE